jgi:hypothetical protein
MTKIKTINPMPPLGYGPQDLLWFQVGMTPMSRMTKMTIRMIPMGFLLSSFLEKKWVFFVHNQQGIL